MIYMNQLEIISSLSLCKAMVVLAIASGITTKASNRAVQQI